MRRYIILEIVGISSNLPEYRLSDLLPYISPFCYAIDVQAPSDLNSFEAFADAGVHAVGLDLSENPETQTLQFRRLEIFCNRANRAGLYKFIHGIDEFSQATFAVCSGFEYIGGAIIGKSVDTPERGYRFQPTDLFSHLLAAP